MPDGGAIINVSSDAAVEPYAGWGGYGSSKAALDQLSAILAEEHPTLRVYSVDPGDMRTQMHQDAFPGEDISDRPPPEESVPGLLTLIEGDLPSGRYRARELRAGAGVTALAFELRPALEAHEPPEARGLARDGVRLLVARRSDGAISHHVFSELPELLEPGDVVVVNISATIPAAVPATRADGTNVRVHFATRAPQLEDELAGRRDPQRRRHPSAAAARRRTARAARRRRRSTSSRRTRPASG